MAGEPLYHPLFPSQDSDDDPPHIGSLSICRFDTTLGRMVYVPRKFAAEEIQDLSQISELYGGGRYELIGRNAAGNTIVARRTYDVAGDPKPLVEGLARPAPVAPQPPGYPQPALVAQGAPSWMPLVIALMPLALEFIKSSAAERQAMQLASQQQMQNIMTQGQASSQAFIQAMSSLFASHSQKGGSIEEFHKGIEFAENMLAERMKAFEDQGGGTTEDVMKTIGQALEAAKMLGMGSGPAGPVVAT